VQMDGVIAGVGLSVICEHGATVVVNS